MAFSPNQFPRSASTAARRHRHRRLGVHVTRDADDQELEASAGCGSERLALVEPDGERVADADTGAVSPPIGDGAFAGEHVVDLGQVGERVCAASRLRRQQQMIDVRPRRREHRWAERPPILRRALAAVKIAALARNAVRSSFMVMKVGIGSSGAPTRGSPRSKAS